MSDNNESVKEMKRKITSEQDDRSTHSEKKKRKKEGRTPGGSKVRPKHCPLSERQQLALVMQMTAEENNEHSSTPPPAARKTPGSSGRKDKVNKRNERGETALHIAAIRGELPVIVDLIKQGADINVQDYAGWTPLHEACNRGYPEIAKFLLEAGATVNSKGLDNDYPLHDAVINEHVDLVELLLKHGANPLLPNKHGERPLDMTDNEEIRRMMQNEIISSDESERTDSPLLIEGQLDHSKVDSKADKPPIVTSGSETVRLNKMSNSTASRELFKQFDPKTYAKKTLSSSSSSSSDSDDSDNLPLSRQRSTSRQSPSKLSSSSSSYDTGSTSSFKRSGLSTGFLDHKWKTPGKQRRLFSTESSDSTDSDAKSQRNQLSDFKPIRKRSVSSEDEIPLAQAVRVRKSDGKSAVEDIPSQERRLPLTVKQPTVTISSTKFCEPDVYDFSPTADEFSSASDGISLKPESRAFSKWQSPVMSKAPINKHSSLFPRKPNSIFTPTKGFEFNAKKPSWESCKSDDGNIGKESSEKTVLIRPVAQQCPKTSEMLFDRLFKSPQKNEKTVSFGDKLSSSFNKPVYTSSFFKDTSVSTTASNSTSTFTMSGAIPITSVFVCGSNVPRIEKTKTFAPSLVFSARPFMASSEATVSKPDIITMGGPFTSSAKPSVTIGNSGATRTLSQVLNDGKQLEKPFVSDSMIQDKPVHKGQSQSVISDAVSLFGTSRSLSLDNTPDGKKVSESDKTQSTDAANVPENKPLRKVIKTEIKEKVFKTFSDPVKKATAKPNVKDAKSASIEVKKTPLSQKSSQPASQKKETKNDNKKVVTIIPDTKSNFMSDIESVSRQRHQEKLKRKKLLQKKSKPSPASKSEDRKPSKRPEVKLLDTDSWLGNPAEKTMLDKQRKTPKTKKVSDSSEISLSQRDDILSSPAKLQSLEKPENTLTGPWSLPAEEKNFVLTPRLVSQNSGRTDHFTVSQASVQANVAITGMPGPHTKPQQFDAALNVQHQPVQTEFRSSSTDSHTFAPGPVYQPAIMSPSQFSARNVLPLAQSFSSPGTIPCTSVSAANTVRPLPQSSYNQTGIRLVQGMPSQYSATKPSLITAHRHSYPDINAQCMITPQAVFEPGNQTELGNRFITETTMHVQQHQTTVTETTVENPLFPAFVSAISDTVQLRNTDNANVFLSKHISHTATTTTSVVTSVVSSVELDQGKILQTPALVDDKKIQQPISDVKDGDENMKKEICEEAASKAEESTSDSEVVKLNEEERMLQEYIQHRLSLAKIFFENAEQRRLPVYIPLSELLERKKDPAVDRLNVYEERAVIQKQMYEKRKKITTVIPQAPQYYWEYMTFTGGYLLNGSRESHLSVPMLGPPPSLCEPMVELFNMHEERRVRLRVQHAIQREKLIMSCEQEIMRVHCRAARTIQNQQVPFSACAMLMDNEVYNMPRATNDNEPGKTSIRDRFNARMFISWLQDVDDKYEKMKSALLARQKHEAEAMFAVQKTEWILKRQELDHSHRALKADEINEVYVPMVNIADDFDLLPA